MVTPRFILIPILLTLAACNRALDAPSSTPSAPSVSAAPSSQPNIQNSNSNSKLEIQNSPTWLSWSDAVFAQAKRENKCVIMDLEAVWCHWCHVMDEVTYRDPAVAALLQKGFLAIKVDQDARPDIAARYEKYGWPGTIIFAPDGTEIVKRQGYITPGGMQSLLQACIDDPTPGPSAQEKPLDHFSTSPDLSPELRRQLEKNIIDTYDPTQAGWGTIHKYLNAPNLEYCLNQSTAQPSTMAHSTLDQARKLIDPVWGGLYQYSTDGDWDHPHYERIIQFQSDGIRIYALAYEKFHDPAYLQAANDIARFLRTFLRSPDGAFYVSMDADAIPGDQAVTEKYAKLDDAARRKIGIPRIDQHIYARENGWAITALAELYRATKNPADLTDARTAAHWILTHRSINDSTGAPTGGFRHDNHDAAGPYLADTLAMAQAFLAFYQADHNPEDLICAHAAATFINNNFPGVPTSPETFPTQTTIENRNLKIENPGTAAGVITAAPEMGQHAYLQLEENADTARLALALFTLTHDPAMEELAHRAQRYLATLGIAANPFSAVTILLACPH